MQLIDTHYLNVDRAIGCFLLESTDGYVLIETGPNSAFSTLKKTLADKGVSVRDVKHVFLTHIHLDHAGNAWVFAKEGATIYVHPFGYPHMKDPAKLLASAKQVYGDDMEKTWGTLAPIPAHRLRAVEDKERIQIGELSLTAHHTPGHASHHICWQWQDVLFAGDVAGIRIHGGPAVPPCPPPDVSIERWLDSVRLLQELSPAALHLTHYGTVHDVDHHLTELVARLHRYAAWVKQGMDNQKSKEAMCTSFVAYVEEEYKAVGLSKADTLRYHTATPPALAVTGLMRYWRKKDTQLQL